MGEAAGGALGIAPPPAGAGGAVGGALGAAPHQPSLPLQEPQLQLELPEELPQAWLEEPLQWSPEQRAPLVLPELRQEYHHHSLPQVLPRRVLVLVWHSPQRLKRPQPSFLSLVPCPPPQPPQE